MSAMNADLNISAKLIAGFGVGALLLDREKSCMSVPFLWNNTLGYCPVVTSKTSVSV